MYTIESLKEKFLDFHEKAVNDQRFGSEPKPLFHDDGSFNSNNWNSNQDDIRTRIYNVLSPRSQCLLNIESDEPVGNIFPTAVILVHVDFSDDQWYILINVICEDTGRYDSYIVSWYKNRGTTEMITYNGRPINIDEYVSLLNTLERGKFFETESWE